jgi:hypothetical protein
MRRLTFAAEKNLPGAEKKSGNNGRRVNLHGQRSMK